MDIRIKATGAFVSEQAFRQMHPNVSFPAELTNELLQVFGADKIIKTAQPAMTALQMLSSKIEQDPQDGLWKQVWVTESVEVASAKAILKQRVTEKRWMVETGSIDLGGSRINTGVDDQNRISNVVLNGQRMGLPSVKFKGATGWVEMPLANVVAIADAVALHVQACFARECDHHTAIDAIADIEGGLTAIEQLEAYDINAGWPANYAPEAPVMPGA